MSEGLERALRYTSLNESAPSILPEEPGDSEDDASSALKANGVDELEESGDGLNH